MKLSYAVTFLIATVLAVCVASLGRPVEAVVCLSLVGSALAINCQPGHCYANTLTSLIPDFYAALDVVSRELVGFIPGISRDSNADRCALNQSMRSHQTRKNTGGRDITPAMAFPAASDQTIDNKAFVVQKSRAFPFSWTGEEIKSVNAGPGFLNIKQDQIAQAIRAAVNEIETDIAVAAKNGGSRAYGTAGTTPFASDLSETANVRKILDDNGTPQSDRHLVINTTAGAKVRTLSQLTKANEAADTQLLRQGTLLDIHGFALRESAQVQSTTAGTGSGYLINNGAGYAIGDTALTLDTGSGTILAGDVVTIGAHKYVVATALAANVVTLAAPGLVAAVADNATVTVNATSARNIGYSRNAILLGTRLPALPPEGDMALDRMTITDPRSGLSFELAMYPGYRMMVYEVGIAWGVLVTKPEHVAVLLG